MPAPAPGADLAFEHVTKTYGSARAIDDVSLAIPGGQFVALVGASGSGKSTLLGTINRLVVPDAGRVLIDGHDVVAEPAPALRRRIGYVFQSIGLFPHMSVAQNVAIGLRIAGRTEGGRVAELLDLVELPRDIAARRPDQLSGGQRQRVAIARALAPGAKLLLLDEALGALDPVTRASLGASIARLHAELALTTILVTHDMAEALLLATRVVVMAAGQVVADEVPAALMRGAGGHAAQALVGVAADQARALAALA